MGIAGQVVAVMAVLAGAAASYIATRLSDRARYARDLAIRWDQRRLDAYSSFMSASKTTGTLANRIHESRLSAPGAVHDTDVQRMQDSDLRRAEAFEGLVLLAGAQTIRAAHKLNHAAWHLVHPAKAGRTLDESDWRQLADRWINAINDLHEAAREDLRVLGVFPRRDVAALAISQPDRASWEE